MSEEQSSYRGIMKATSVFGGVQVFNILITIIRSKLIAVLIGPAGMGIYGLLNSTTSLVSTLTNFGLGTSAVKNVAEANKLGDINRISTVVISLRRWIWITGLLGSVLVIIFSPLLSQITFGNKDYTVAFILISVTLLFNQISSGQMVLLQGMRQIKHLANANLTGALLGLIISVPIYYMWGIKGIVPTIVISSVASMLRSWYFAGKVKIEKVKVDRYTTINIGREMLKMGFMLSLGSLISAFDYYLLRIYISNVGGVDQVGLYNAAFAILNSYVGLIFTAMATDYYPKLSEINKDNKKIRILVTQQATVAILMLIPIIVLFLTYATFIIKILYSTKFLTIIPLMEWAIIGMLFRGVSWSLGFILIAKGDSKMVLISSLLSHSFSLLLNIIAYKLLGLRGLGISFTVNVFIYLIAMVILTKHKYDFKFQSGFFKIFSMGFTFCLLAFITAIFLSSTVSGYMIGTFILVLSSVYSLYELNKKLNLKEPLLKFLNMFKLK